MPRQPREEPDDLASADTQVPVSPAEALSDTQPAAAEDGPDAGSAPTALAAGSGTPGRAGGDEPRVAGDLEGWPPVEEAHYAERTTLAMGGMGRILTARDRRLRRKVAIKELRAHGPELIARFRREALITARLAHPSIVTVHEAGVWPGGEPFFAMKLVAGRPLDEVVAAAKTLDERLALTPRVIAIAEALAYAHSERVIHRDLKPANVIVGDFGETVVIDWGLAKDLADDGHRESPDAGPYRRPPTDPGGTTAGQILGTPAYMPPEQAEGAEVDERADVYAIGALLYHVLAGRPPYTGKTADEVLDAVRREPPPEIPGHEDIPRDLLAIVRRAMARAPAHRYPSARELAEDLRRFEAGQLVGAHRYSAGQLLRRWLRRHRVAVGVAAVALGLLVVMGGIGIHRIDGERQVALAHRADAEDLMDFMLRDLYDRLEPIGRLDVLAEVARKANEYYGDRPVPSRARDRRQQAMMLENLGDIHRSEGDFRASLASYQKGLAIAETLAGEDDDPEHRRLVARISARLVRAHEGLGESDAALEAARRAVSIMEQHLERDDDPSARSWDLRALASYRSTLADILAARGKIDEAFVEYRDAQALLEPLAEALPDDARLKLELATNHEKVGGTLLARGEHDEARAELEGARRLREQALAQRPEHESWRFDLAVSLVSLGDLNRAQGDHASALEHYRSALAIGEQLMTERPERAEWVRSVAVAHDRIAHLAAGAGDLEAALAGYREALAIRKRLAARDAEQPGRGTRHGGPAGQRDLAVSHFLLGDILSNLGRRDEASVEYRALKELASELATLDPSNVLWQRDLLMAYEKVGETHVWQGNIAAAWAHYQAAHAIALRLAALDPDNQTFAADVNALGEMLQTCCSDGPWAAP
jgi:tetratricopeptide (TPR) repeat protein